ncbi:hypothetical protein [Secundilactobacillus kimchicus]|uniref:hypothetical protein n=1 Tax=Secundilactobacillus kimchicus TaxID=528209 RepID=UPI0024369FA9|nr:hypothetical protein [Secundilactobacillus kimchicus]
MPDLTPYLTGPLDEIACFTEAFGKWGHLELANIQALTTFFFYRVGLLQVADAEQDRLLATVIGSDRIVLDLAQHELKHITEYQPFFHCWDRRKPAVWGLDSPNVHKTDVDLQVWLY